MKLEVIDAEPIGTKVIEVLELAMEMARTGQLSSISVVGIVRDGAPYWNYSDAPNTSALIGASERMKFEIISETDG